MLRYIEGNIFESPAQTLVNTVNTAGAMGKGLARQFKRLFPEMFKSYQLLCESGELDVGKLWIYQTANKWVQSFPTKKHWRRPSSIDYVEDGLRTFVNIYDRVRISSIAFPQLGCGNGELEWASVKPLMESYLKKLPIDVYIYEVNRPVVPEHKELKRMREWLMSEPQSLPFDSFRAELEQVLSKKDTFTNSAGERIHIFFDEVSTTFEGSGISATIPWEGDDTSSGWLQLWQFIREKGACTIRDIENMGLPQAETVIALLLELSPIKPLQLVERDLGAAIMLAPCTNQPSLFSDTRDNGKTIQL